MTVRPARSADAPVVAALEARAALHPWSAASVREALESPHSVAFVALRGGAAAGYLLARAVAGEGEILTLGVDPSARREGLGHALLTACEDAWRAAGVASAWLDVADGNVAALALYQAHGWRDAARRRDYYGPGRDARVLAWSP